MNRRKFIKSTAVGLSGIIILPACADNISPYRFFTIDEAKCITAITEQIIPADDKFAGAEYAGVTNYIDIQLTNVFITEQTLYRKGIKAVQQTCKKLYSKKFEELEFDPQTKFLESLEKNNIDEEFWTHDKPANFFNIVLSHTMQGFYGSPRHGGNKNYISYRMLDLDYPLIIGQNRYRGLNGK